MILDSLTAIVRSYLTELNNIPAPTQEEWNREAAKCREKMLSAFNQVGLGDPFMTPINLIHTPQNVVEIIQKQSQSRYTLPYLLASTYRDRVQGDIFVTPNYLPWQVPGNKEKNFVINYSDDASKQKAINTLNQMVMTILLAFSIKKVHVTILDLEMASDLVFLTGNLDKQLVSHVIDERGLSSLVEYLKEDMLSDASTAGFTTQEEYNESQKKIEGKYELVLIPSTHGAHYARLQETLLPFFQNAQKNGTYFFVLNDTTQSSVRPDADHILKHTDVYQLLDAKTLNDFSGQENAIIKTTSFANDPTWSMAMFEYINQKANETIAVQHDWNAMAATPYKDTDADIVAPIGYTESGEVFNFRMDVSKQHYHAFVIGATGSGKSRFLHDVILSMTTKYSPEDLELYLMDFKGVEFNCYRDFKHVRTVLVDRADERITYEVIKDLKVKMEQRQRILAQAGASDVAEYNREHMGEHLSQIILIADECQTLFADRAKNGKLQNEMVDIIALIAQQGRAYGVHLLLATQSLANAPQLGKDILNQISEHYILPCLPADAGRLVPDHARNETERVVAKMEKGKGQCYYQGAEENVFFTFNYVSKGEMQSQLVSAAVEKAQENKSNGQVFFSGSLQYSLDERAADYIESKSRRAIVASPGQEISLEQTPLTISLKDDMSENILLMGINDEHFVTRTSFGVLTSLMLSNIRKDFGYCFMVLDCLADEEAEYIDVLDHLEDERLCQVISGRKRGETLKRLCDEIASENVKPTILFIHGQERFRELKLNIAIEEKEDVAEDNAPNSIADTLTMMRGLNFGEPVANSNKKADIKTMRDAVNYILDKGPELGVHTVMQLDKPGNFLFSQDSYPRKQDIYAKFKHLIVLRSDEMVAGQLMLRDDIRLHTMESNPDRLRAYYYNEESDKYALFTPYLLPTENDINKLLK